MTKEDEERKHRFRTAVKALGIDREVIAEQLGYKKNYLNQVLSSSKGVSEMVIIKFTKRYKKFNPDWLLKGSGRMEVENADELSSQELQPIDPFEALRALMEKHERRISDLEDEVRLLKEGREYESKG